MREGASRAGGDPASTVLLLSGLAALPSAWDPVRPWLGDRRVVAPVNRGTLPGDEPRRLRVRRLAEDAAEALDAAGAESAHVVGNSLGGMIAQELALRHPGRVRSLSLLATSPGTVCVPLSPAAMLTLARAGLARDEKRERLLRRCLRAAWAAGRAPAGGACLDVLSPRGARAQVGAAARWSSIVRLPRAAAPTLVVHGAEDRLVPAANARILVRRIPGARLEMVRDAGHLLLDDAPERVGAVLAAFLVAVEQGLPPRHDRDRRAAARLAPAPGPA